MDAPIDPRFAPRLARRLAARLEGDPDTLAWVFARYRDAEGIDEAGLAAYFGLDPDVVAHLSLCGRPREGLFLEDVTAAAERYGFDPDRLAVLLRHVDALHEFRREGAQGRARFLAAARDRAAEDTPTYDTGAGSPPETGDGGGTAGDAGKYGGRR